METWSWMPEEHPGTQSHSELVEGKPGVKLTNHTELVVRGRAKESQGSRELTITSVGDGTRESGIGRRRAPYRTVASKHLDGTGKEGDDSGVGFWVEIGSVFHRSIRSDSALVLRWIDQRT